MSPQPVIEQLERGDDGTYRRTLDSLLEGFQIIGFDWRYRYVNPSAARQGQTTPEQLTGRLIWEAYPGIDRRPLFEELRRAMIERVGRSLENRFTPPDGIARWFELRVQPVPEGICVHSVDIDDRKQAEAALRRLNDELEARVAARTAELASANRELEAFSYSVSHDLRAPLRHVSGFARLLTAHAGPALDGESRDYLVRIGSAVARMDRLIDDLLQFSRLGRGALSKRRVALGAIVADARKAVAAESASRDVAWSIPELPEVLADPQLLQLVLVNLLSNALKYSRGRCPARIEITARRDEALGVVVCVRDNGVGFDMRYAHRLFGVFQRLHPAEDFEGTGIGLANVRRIVQRHGGLTWAEGEIDRGAAIYFSLPEE